MAQNIRIAGASYAGVPAITVPRTDGGSASFVDTSDATATSEDISAGKVAYAGGLKLVGTGAAPIVRPSGYASDGLVLWLDGIANTRRGHEAFLSKWEDLSGNGFDFVPLGPLDFPTVGSDSLSGFTSEGRVLYNADLQLNPFALSSADATLEVVCKLLSGEVGVCFLMWNKNASFGGEGYSKGIWGRPANSGAVVKTDPNRGGFYARSPLGTRFGACIEYDASAVEAYISGDRATVSQLSSGSGTMENTLTTIGGRYRASGTDYLLKSGEVCAVRLYSRKLSSTERSQNWAVDRERFGL